MATAIKSKLHLPGWAWLPLAAVAAAVAWLLAGQVLAAFLIVGGIGALIVADIATHPGHLLRYGAAAVVLVALLKGPAGPTIDQGAGLPRNLNDVIGAEASNWWAAHGPTQAPIVATPPATPPPAPPGPGAP